MAAMKINLMKLLHTINANTVRDRSYENFLHKNLSYESFFARKSTVLRYDLQINAHIITKDYKIKFRQWTVRPDQYSDSSWLTTQASKTDHKF